MEKSIEKDLQTHVNDYFRMDKKQKAALKRLKLETLQDLLYHFPTRYEEAGSTGTVNTIEAGEKTILYGVIRNITTKKSFRGGVPMSTGELVDENGRVGLSWFHQPYIARMYPDGTKVKIEGTPSNRGSKLNFVNPTVEKISEIPVRPGQLGLALSEENKHTLTPVYPVSAGITSQWVMFAIRKIISDEKVFKALEDAVPTEVIKKYKLPTLKTALIWLHSPKSENDAQAARKRMAFDEVFYIQVEKQQARLSYSNNKGFVIDSSYKTLKPLLDTLPFKPTGAQKNALEVILEDMASGRPMLRLLEGDVGSGKSLVAAGAIFATIKTHPLSKKTGVRQDFGALQAVYMAPTEILAKQQFDNFCELLKPFNVTIGLITGKNCYKYPSKVNPGKSTRISKAQLLKWVANGEIALLTGTHAAMQKKVAYKDLGLAIIDEQHRFGTRQRQALVNKNTLAPHYLSMTATPIPRTLALTIYGDLDITLIDELPAGRKPVITNMVLPHEREDMYEHLRTQLDDGRQVYILCPRIDEPDPSMETAVIAKSVTAEAKRLQKGEFKNYRIGILHGKMTPNEKDEIMQSFSNHEIDVLVTTSVVEVGVNIPNATAIVIEGAERFGLAQLHQLRGRVVRSSHQAYCYLLSESASKKTQERLGALKDAKNGFELAEFDLGQRGSGELYGRKQAGVTDLGMEAIKNIKMVEAARAEAASVLKKSPRLKKYPALLTQIDTRRKLHEE